MKKAFKNQNGLPWSFADYVGAHESHGHVDEALDQNLLMEELGLYQVIALFQKSGYDERNCGCSDSITEGGGED